MKSIIIALALILGLFSVAHAESHSVYHVDGTVRATVEQFVEIPDIIKDANIKVTIEAYPKQRYYKTKVELLTPINRVCKFTKTLEVWDDKQVVRSSIDIDLNLRLRFLKRILEPRIECAILQAEKAFLRKRLTNGHF